MSKKESSTSKKESSTTKTFAAMQRDFHVPSWADNVQSRVQSKSSCGRFPYPNNEIVSHLTCSIDRGILCQIRDTLFDEGSVKDNAVDFPSVYDGGVFGNNNRLSPRQLLDLKNMLNLAYASTHLRFDIDSLVACKIVVGRWLRPSEMAGLFGKNASGLVMKRYAISAEDDDDEVSTEGGDPRVSYAIGRAGATLNKVTAKSRTIYIWFGTIRGKACVYIYGRVPQSLEKARMLLNKHQATFRSKGQGQAQHGFHVEASAGAPRVISLGVMYKMLSS